MSKGRILVVDDTATYRTMLGDTLTAKGYEVIYATDGLEAIQIVKEEFGKIDLMLLDLLMPKMLGFDALREIRNMEGGDELPVMVISGLFKGVDEIKRVRELGAAGFLDKSVPIEEIANRVDGFLHPEWEDKFEGQVNTSLLVTYKVGEKPFSAYTFSIGPTGMFLKTKNAVPPGADVILRFRLYDQGQTIEIKGKVRVVITESGHTVPKKLPPGIAVDFSEISEADSAAINQWIGEQPK